MGGGGHNNFHRGILKVPVKLFFWRIFLVDSWNRWFVSWDSC